MDREPQCFWHLLGLPSQLRTTALVHLPLLEHFDLHFLHPLQFLISSFRPWRFSSFSYSYLILLLLGTSMSVTTTAFCSLSTTKISSWLASTFLSVWIWKSNRIFVLIPSTGVSYLHLKGSSLYWSSLLSTVGSFHAVLSWHGTYFSWSSFAGTVCRQHKRKLFIAF